MKFLRFIDGHLKGRLLSGLNDEEARLAFSSYIEGVNDLCRAAYDKINSDVALMVENDRKHTETIEDEVKKVKQHLSEKRAEENLIQAQKNKQARIFTEAEKSNNLHWSTYSEEDLIRSKENLLNKKQEAKKAIRDLEKQILELDEQIKPHAEKITDCKAKLETDLDEKSYKDIRLSKEFNESQIEKLQSKILPLSEENSKLYKQIQEADKQLKLLDILIDASELKKDAFLNFPRRRERLLQRLNQILKQMNELETLRENLNQRWRDISNDSQDIIGPLGLKADSQMYFI